MNTLFQPHQLYINKWRWKEMKIKIEFGIEKGQKFEYISIDGNPNNYSEASRKLTGSTDEDANGIFNYSSSNIKYGEYIKHFEFGKPLNIFEMSTQEYTTEVLSRAQVVRNWIKTIDFKDEIEFEISLILLDMAASSQPNASSPKKTRNIARAYDH